MKTPIYAVFDVSHAGMKLTLFDEARQFLDQHEEVCLTDVDDDGFPCESLEHITQWVLEHWYSLRHHPEYHVRGVNFVAYGSSLVHLGADDRPVLPLYSYLKPLPEEYTRQFFATLDQTPEAFALATRSPYLGIMNSGMQLYWLKYAKPALYAQIQTSLHLPQYLSFLISGEKFSDYTSVGCHTALWDFDQHSYHTWVAREGIDQKLAPLLDDAVATVIDGTLVGVGLHDSSAAVLPHLTNYDRPFAVLATGTWAVTINPFNRRPPTIESLQRNCPHYLSPKGDPFPASRFLLGREHDYQVRRIAMRFHTTPDFYQALPPTPLPIPAADAGKAWQRYGSTPQASQPAQMWDLSGFGSAAEAYHYLLHGLVTQLCEAIRLAVQNEKVLFVEGRFGESPLFIEQLRTQLPDLDIRTSAVPWATALGTLIQLEQGEASKKTRSFFF